MANVPHAHKAEQAPEPLVALDDPAARLARALTEQATLALRGLADQVLETARQSLARFLVASRSPALDLADPRILAGEGTRRAVRLYVVSRASDGTSERALETCLRAYFTPQFLYPARMRARWYQVVRPRLVAYARAHGLTVDEAWRDVAVPALWLALRECGGAGDQAAVAKVMRRHLEAFLGCGELTEVLLGVELASELDLDAALLVTDLEQALAQLDERDRALALMKLRGHRAKEIAERLGMTPTAVDMRWSRLRRQLEQRLA